MFIVVETVRRKNLIFQQTLETDTDIQYERLLEQGPSCFYKRSRVEEPLIEALRHRMYKVTKLQYRGRTQ